MIWALLFERVIFHHTPDSLSIIGSTLIISGALWVALKKKPVSSPVEDKPSEVEMADLDDEIEAELLLRGEMTKPQVDWCATSSMIPVVVDGEDVRLVIPDEGGKYGQ